MKLFSRFFDFFDRILINRDIRRRRQAAHTEWSLLMSRGAVREVLLLPAELGGIREPRNITYLPPDAMAEKLAFDAKVHQAIAAGDKVNYEAVPQYEGNSFVPATLRLSATGNELQLDTTISVKHEFAAKPADPE
jgi:hypothetical protein